MQVPAKPWWQSWTIWFNVVGGLVVLAEYATTLDLGETVMQIAAAIIVVGNFILRLKTDKPVATTSGKMKLVA